MSRLNESALRILMDRYGVAPRKKYGQNFLVDESVLDAIVEGSKTGQSDTVLEIGPGLGVLTGRLAAVSKRVIAVEIDDGLIPLLRETLADHDNVTVINRDILDCDIEALNNEYADGEGFIVVANLPYYITTPIILRLLEYSGVIRSMTVMVQKEVALRMQAEPGSKDYGALSLAVQYRSVPEIVTEAGAEAFFPSPAVDSAVVRLDMSCGPRIAVSDEAFMFKIIRATFNMRRKTLSNALSAQIPGITREDVCAALESMGKPVTVRGETFGLNEFAALTDILSDR